MPSLLYTPPRPRARKTKPQEKRVQSSSVMRMFEILDLFTEETPVWSGTELERHLGNARTTTYRYIKSLCDVGLLLGIGKNLYCLGPRIVQLERQIQLTDPLLAAGRTVMPTVVEDAHWDVMLLCSLSRFSVLCIHQETRKDAGGGPLPIRRARGMPFSLLEGPASLAILAHLKPHQATALFLRQRDGIAAAGLGATWEEFRKHLRTMRNSGIVASVGSFGSNLAAIAAPVFDSSNRVIGSVTGIMRESEFAHRNSEELAAGIVACAKRISQMTGTIIPRSITPTVVASRGNAAARPKRSR